MKEVFPIFPASSGAMWFVAGFALFMALMVGLFASFGWASKYTSFEVTPESLAIHGDLYSRTVPRTELLMDQAKVINLKEDREHRMALRTNGCAFPGYASGWFRLVNGEKALVFVTSRNEVLYIPTTKGYSLLLSAKQPYSLLDALRGH